MLRFFYNIVFLILVAFLPVLLFAQGEIDEVDFGQIKYKSIKTYLIDQKAHGYNYFSDFQPSIHEDDDLSEYLNFEKSYLIKQPVELVWDNYYSANITEVWDMNRVSFGLLYSREMNSVFYADQEFYGFKKGQIYYLNLKILNGIYNLPVAFEVIKVAPESKLIEFSYLKGGKAQGKQMIQMFETAEGYTKILHKSYVKSNSKIRDKYLYPFFHNKIINEFHNNLKRLITERSKYLKRQYSYKK